MQRVTNAMADTVLMFINLFMHVRSFCGDIIEAEPLLATIEKRWYPLIFHAFILHLRYQLAAQETVRLSSQNHGAWTERKNPLSITRLLSAAVFLLQEICTIPITCSTRCKTGRNPEATEAFDKLANQTGGSIVYRL
jgi:hypothetical protein